TWDEGWISAFVDNLAPAPQPLELWLEEGLRPGNYTIDVGPTSPKCDSFGSGAPLTTTHAVKRGAGLRVPITLPPGPSLVRVARDASAFTPAAAFDAALDPPELEVHKQGLLNTLVFRVHVANVGA